MPSPRIDPHTGKPLPVGVYLSGRDHYQYRIKAGGKTEIRGGFLTADDAFVARHLRLVALGQAEPVPALTDRTVAVYLPLWLERHSTLANLKPTTCYDYQTIIDSHIVPHLGDVLIRRLTTERVREWCLTLARDHSLTTAHKAKRLLAQALQPAVVDELIPRNVAALVELPSPPKRPIVILSPDECIRFLDAADNDPWRALWYVGLLCQLRPGELAGLRWSDVNLDEATLKVRISRTRNDAGKWIIGDSPKRPASVREIALPASCVAALREHRRAQKERIIAAPHGVWQDNDLVFPNGQGRVLANGTIEQRLRTVCKAAGVTVITPHSLRRSGNTWARTLGENIEVMQRRLGHTSPDQTIDYSLATPGEQRRASDRLDTALANARRKRAKRDAG